MSEASEWVEKKRNFVFVRINISFFIHKALSSNVSRDGDETIPELTTHYLKMNHVISYDKCSNPILKHLGEIRPYTQ